MNARRGQIVGAVLLIVCGLLYLNPDVPWMPDDGGDPEVERLIDNSDDAHLIAAYLRAAGEMVVEDGRHPNPRMKTARDVIMRITHVGAMTIGPGWKIGDRYPGLPGLIAERVQDRVPASGEIDREAFQKVMDELAEALDSV